MVKQRLISSRIVPREVVKSVTTRFDCALLFSSEKRILIYSLPGLVAPFSTTAVIYNISSITSVAAFTFC
ncbi:MAG TPA: hypothetical protein VFN35_18460 [Ktedonobacteraceae bacterium]|nr:hypothetical protein [Ktedonobacteraceae bacterium]